MRFITFTSAMIAILLWLPCASLTGQFDISVKPKFFSLRDARLSIGLNVDLTLYAPPENGDDELILYQQYLGNNGDLSLGALGSNPFIGFGLSLDLFAPNSFIGFSSGANYRLWDFQFLQGEDKNPTGDSYEMQFLEIPLWLKFRPGDLTKNQHFLLLVGPAFNIPLGLKYNGSDGQEDRLQNFISLGAMIGYDAFSSNASSRSRYVIYLKGQYYFENPFDQLATQRIVSTLSNSQLNFSAVVVSVGAQYYFRL